MFVAMALVALVVGALAGVAGFVAGSREVRITVSVR
jgi:hypothetical protein